MAASYPTSAKSFSTKATTNVVEAAHVNDIQDEVTAIETAMLTGGLAHNLIPSGTRTLGNSSTFWDKGYVTALILGAETTSGVRLDVNAGVLEVLEGDDSAYGALKALTLETTSAATFAGSAYVGDTSNANMTLGLTINQGAADNEILALKSSDVAHGVTGIAETDTYGTFAKVSATAGGTQIRGFSSGTVGVQVLPIITTQDATRSTAAVGPIYLGGQIKNGVNNDAMSANQNILCVGNSLTTRFILDSDGDSHQDVGTAWTNFDSHDDALVLDSLAYLVSRDDDPYKDAIRKGFGEALESMIPRQELERIKLVTFNEDGHHFLNMSKLTMLLTGAVRQIAGQVRQIEARIDRALPEAL